MPALFAENLLGPDGWMSNVTIAITEDGAVQSLTPNSDAGNGDCFKVVLPGIVNAHSHAFQRAMAGLAEHRSSNHDTFWTWREAMYKVALSLTPEDQRAVSTYLQIELLKYGYTSLVEFHYLHHQPCGRPYDEVAAMSLANMAAADDSGIGLTLIPTLYMTSEINGAGLATNQRRFGTDVETIDKIMIAASNAAKGNNNCAIGMAAHSLRAVPLPELAALLELRQSKKIKPFHMHISEQVREVTDCIAVHGKRPVELLLDLVPVDKDWTLVHATHLNDVETKRLAKTGANAATCPTTEANLGDGIFPLSSYLEHHGQITIGSDSHVCISPWEELRWLEYVQRLSTKSRNILTSHQKPNTGTNLLTLMTNTASNTTGRQAGWLNPGARADLIILDEAIVQFSGRSAAEILDTAIFACNVNPVRHVMVGGQWRIRDGRHHLDDRATDDYRRVVKKLAEGI